MHAIKEWLSYPDPWLCVLTAYVFVLGGIGGWAICQVTHKQRGIEVDRPITDILPVPPPPIVVLELEEGWSQDDQGHVHKESV